MLNANDARGNVAAPENVGFEDVRNRLIGLVRHILGEEGAIAGPFPTDRQLSDLGISSLKMLNLMLAVEVEFDIAIPQTEITPENFHSVESMQTLTERLLRR